MNQTFESTLSKNQSLMEAYARMKSGKTITERHEQLNEAKLSDAQMKKREEIVFGLKKNKDDLEKRYGKDWESVMYAIATKQALAESMETEGDSLFIPKEVHHKFFSSDGIHSHSFEPEDKEKVHKHLVSLGFKQQGYSDVPGPATETKYVHPSGMIAYLGNNRVKGWLDIQK